MTDESKKEDTVTIDTSPVIGTLPVDIIPTPTNQRKKNSFNKTMPHNRGLGTGRGAGNKPGGRGRFGARGDLDQKVLSIRRVARVIAGGKRFTFSVCLVLGDKKGSVGVGLAKAGGTSEAIEKATRDAKKNMIKVNTTKTMSIPHETRAKYCSGVVDLRPAPGRGLIAGSAPRVVLALAGITDINAKIISGSKNKINNARATWLALQSLAK